MKEELKRLASEEVANEFEEMGTMKLGSDEHVKTAEVANKVMDRLIKNEEVENEKRRLTIEERKLDIEEERLKHEKRIDWAKIGVGVTTTIVTGGVAVWGYIDSKYFEKEGYMHSTEAGRSSIRKLLGLVDKLK